MEVVLTAGVVATLFIISAPGHVVVAIVFTFARLVAAI